MNGNGRRNRATTPVWLLRLGFVTIASAFVRQQPFVTKPQIQIGKCYTSKNHARVPSRGTIHSDSRLLVNANGNTESHSEFDVLLEEPSTFRKAIQYLQSHPNEIELSKDRFGRIFDAIEGRSTDAEVNGGSSSDHQQQQQQQSMYSESRRDMTDMYAVLKDQGHLRLFGSITRENMPAAGSHTVAPAMLETITSLSMSSLTPQPSNTLLYAGAVAATAEALASVYFGWDLNALFFGSVVLALCDQVVLNGALGETSVRILSPDAQPKITRHEAGHFLCSYMLGCPLEGYVLSPWVALQDPRFRGRGVSAGTAFFDPNLTSEIEKSKITRSSIDRYSIIVMAGIAAEAVMYGRADGGASDEQALITFLSNLNGGKPSSTAPTWNDLTIRNQARWGALQSVLILREYQECYDALVEVLERGGSLGDCIYAIEDAARRSNKGPLRVPLGYISEDGGIGTWNKIIPSSGDDDTTENPQAAMSASSYTPETKRLDPDESLETLRAYKEAITNKLKDIDEKLENI